MTDLVFWMLLLTTVSGWVGWFVSTMQKERMEQVIDALERRVTHLTQAHDSARLRAARNLRLVQRLTVALEYRDSRHRVRGHAPSRN